MRKTGKSFPEGTARSQALLMIKRTVLTTDLMTILRIDRTKIRQTGCLINRDRAGTNDEAVSNNEDK